MLGLIKKIHRHHDELLSLMLLLSLIRIDPRTPFPPHVVTRGSQLMAAVENDLHRQIMNDVPRLHPKSVEASLARYQEELFADLNDLGRFSIDFGRNQDITAYLLDETDRSSETPSLGVVVAGSSTASQPLENVVDRGSTSLSAEDADLIEILWKQDIDLGIPRDLFRATPASDQVGDHLVQDLLLNEKYNAKVNDSKHVNASLQGDDEKKIGDDDVEKERNQEAEDQVDPWAGLAYTIEDETGEYILQEREPASGGGDSGCEDDADSSTTASSSSASTDGANSSAYSSLDKALGLVHFDSTDFAEDKLTDSNFTLGALSPQESSNDEQQTLVGNDDPLLGSISAPQLPLSQPPPQDFDRIFAEQENSLELDSLVDDTNFDLGFYLSHNEGKQNSDSRSSSPAEAAGTSSVATGAEADAEQSDDISDELESRLDDMIQAAQMHPRSLQVRMPLMRTVSMEHRWQDLANFLSLPDGHGANLTTHHSHHNTVHHHHGGHHHSGHAALLTSSPHSHPFAHPYPHPHSHPHPHPHSIGNHSNPNGHYGVHHSAAAAHAHAAAQAAAHAAHAAVGHHHYGGMPATATPVSAYSMSQAGGGGGGGSGGGGSGDSASSTGAGRVTAVAATSVLLGHNASLTEIGVANGANNGSYPSPVSLGSGVTLGSAVTTSMNLTSNGTSEALEPAVQVSYKTESTPDMHQLYYQNNTSEVNQTGDGFFPSIFNEDDLQLMDMAMTDTMYPTRLLEGQSVGQHHSVQVLTNVTGVSTSASGVGATTATISVPSSTVIGDTTSDSAVSSMGSERVPSISDGDWIDSSGVGNDSNATATGGASAVVPSTSAYSIDYASGAKYRHYEYGYGARQNGGPGGDASGAGPRSVAAPVAQKKHHMFGKRVFHDQTEMAGSPSTAVHSPQSQAAAQGVVPKFDYGAASAGAMYSPHPSTPLDGATNLHSMDMKYACPMDYNHHPHEVRGTMDHINLNHTYAMGADAGASQRPVSRDKQRASSSGLRGSVSDTSAGAGTSGSSSESEAYSRDEKRARAMNIPMTVDDIINLPMDEFNERLSKYDLTEAQLSLIRDIRRRGKNKVAAQNCRKRKLDQILTLADEVKRVRERKIRLNKEREFLLAEKARIKDRFAQLYRHVFQSLRDADGQPYSPYEYSLQQSADGNILLVPRGASHGAGPIDPQPSVNPAVNGDVHLGARRKNPDHKTEP